LNFKITTLSILISTDTNFIVIDNEFLQNLHILNATLKGWNNSYCLGNSILSVFITRYLSINSNTTICYVISDNKTATFFNKWVVIFRTLQYIKYKLQLKLNFSMVRDRYQVLGVLYTHSHTHTRIKVHLQLWFLY
jgi:hypothetical protein